MNTPKQLIAAGLILAGMCLNQTVIANDNVIIAKFGVFNLDDTTQTIDTFPSSITATFEDDSGSFGVEYEHVFNNNVSIGGGFEISNFDYVSNVGPGDVDIMFLTFNSKYYFTKNKFRPFVGGSVGAALTDFNQSVEGSSSGLALGVMAGFRYQISVVGLYLEYKNYLTADTEDDFDSEVDVAGDSLHVGVSIQF